MERLVLLSYICGEVFSGFQRSDWVLPYLHLEEV